MTDMQTDMQTDIPQRYRDPIWEMIDEAIQPTEVISDLAQWLFSHRHEFFRVGDDEAVHQFGWHLDNIDQKCPEIFSKIRSAIIPSSILAAKKLNLPELNPKTISFSSDLRHHGGHCDWHIGDEEAKLGYVLFLQAEPKMFGGGDLELFNGAAVEPKNNRLVFTPTTQQQRYRKVECWSSHVLHGSWTISGLIY